MLNLKKYAKMPKIILIIIKKHDIMHYKQKVNALFNELKCMINA